MNQLGYYGKTLHRGDFVRFNLPQSFINVWDDWLQQVITHGERQVQAWPDLYAKAPAYRFVLSSGIAGNTPWIGLFRASQDKVGRRFPFCLALSLDTQALPSVIASSRNPFFDEADSLLDRALASEYRFDDLQGELSLLAKKHAKTEPVATDPVSLTSTQPGDAVTISVMSADALQSTRVLPVLLDTVLRQTLGEYSLWMAAGSPEATVISAGLPIESAGLALFDSNWQAASTAVIDLSRLPAGSTGVDSMHTTDDVDKGLARRKVESLSTVGETSVDDSAAPSVRRSESHAQESKDKLHESESGPVEHAPSADDWAALEDSTDATPASTEVILPEVEKLELDEDDLPDAPWER